MNIQEWLNNGAPTVFWIPAFFQAQSFLIANLQAYSRKLNLQIDLVDFDFEFTENNSLREKPVRLIYFRILII